MSASRESTSLRYDVIRCVLNTHRTNCPSKASVHGRPRNSSATHLAPSVGRECLVSAVEPLLGKRLAAGALEGLHQDQPVHSPSTMVNRPDDSHARSSPSEGTKPHFERPSCPCHQGIRASELA